MKVTKNTTDLKIGSVSKAIHIKDDAPFELNKFYKITDSDCVETFKIGNAIAFAYSINELGDYFEHIASLDDIEDLEKKASILKETFEQIKNMSKDKNVYAFTDDSIEQEAIAFLIQDDVFKGDEIELQFICDNMDITMVEKCSCCGKVLMSDDECYSDELNSDDAALCDHCSVFNESTNMYQKLVHQDIIEKLTGLKFSQQLGNVGSKIEEFNFWLNINNHKFGFKEPENKDILIEFINEYTEWNICDCCGLIEKSTELNWDYENLFDEDYQNFRFLQGTKIGFKAVCDNCLNKVGTISQPSLEDITRRIQENQMMHKVFDVVLLENVNFKERNIEQTTVVGEICYIDFNKKIYKLKEFGEHEFKDEDFFDILNLAYVNKYTDFIADNYPEKGDEVDEWSYPNWEGHADIEMAFKNFGYKEEFIEHLKSNDLPYGRFLTPKFNIGDEFQVHFNYYEDNEFTTHKIIEIDTTFAEADEIVYWSEEYVFITESELSRQKNPSSEFNEVLIVKDEVIHQIFCQDSGNNDTVVPTYNELIAAGEILDTWQICEEFQDYCYKSIVNKVNELCEEYFTISEAIICAKKDTQKLKKYSIRQVVEYGVTIEIIEALQRLHKMSDNKELNDNKEIIVLQANISTQDISSIEIALDWDINYIELSKYLKDEVGQSLHKDVNMLVTVIKEAKYDKHNTLYLYDC